MSLSNLLRRWIVGGIFSAIWLAGALTFAQPPGGMGSFFSRMDQNGNGMLEPSEVSDRMRGFLERIAQSDRSISLSRPIPISRLEQAMERARQERERSGGSPWGGGSWGGRGRDDDDDDRDRDRGRGSSNITAPEPLVPGFGTDDLPPVPGFGEDAALMVKVTEQDQREAAERLERYDRNRDGVLDQEELSRGRWGDSPFEYDRNRDGRLSRDELALRYATRRMEEEKEDQEEDRERNSSSSRGGPPSGFNPSGRPSSSGSSSGLDPRMEGIVNSVMGRYDKNQNGVLDRAEWSEMRSDPSGGDRNRDGRISKEELGAWLSQRMQGGFGGGDRGGERGRDGGRDGDRGRDGERGRGGWGGGGWGGGPPGGGRAGGPPGGGGPFGGGPFGGGPFGGPPGGGPFGGGPFGGPPGEGGQPNFYAMRGGWGGGDRGGGDRGGGDRSEGDRRNGDGEDRRRGDRGDDDRRGDSRSDSSNNGNGAILDTRTYRFQSTLDRIDSQFGDLPESFKQSDANADGQISMNEYAAEWPQSKIQEFLTLDANGDGLVTPAEYMKAIESGFRPGASLASAADSSSTGATTSTTSGSSTGGYTESRGASSSAPAASIDERYLKYAQGLVTQYDANKDGVLDKTEAAQVKVMKPDTDADGNGLVTAEELAKSLSKR